MQTSSNSRFLVDGLVSFFLQSFQLGLDSSTTLLGGGELLHEAGRVANILDSIVVVVGYQTAHGDAFHPTRETVCKELFCSGVSGIVVSSKGFTQGVQIGKVYFVGRSTVVVFVVVVVQ